MAAELPAVTAKFCIKLVQDAVAVRTSGFDAVPFLERALFQRKCLGQPPPTAECGIFSPSIMEANSIKGIVARAARPRFSQIAGAIDVHAILEWIDVTQDPKDLDFSSKAMRAWSRILCKHSGMSAEGSAASVRDVGGATLTRARPRVDAVCMLLFRVWFTLVKSKLTVNL